MLAQDSEVATGRLLLQDWRRGAGVTLIDSRMEAFVRRVAARMDLNSSEVAVVDSMRCCTQPAALPGGILVVPVVWFAKARNVDEFAAMLAHAWAHNVMKHGRKTHGQTRIGWLLHAGPDELLPLSLASTFKAWEREADAWVMPRLHGFQGAALQAELEQLRALAQPGPRKAPSLFRKSN